MNINICMHDHTSETREWDKRREMQSANRGRSQLSIVLHGNIGDHESPPASECKLDELVELFSDHIEGTKTEDEIRHERDQVQK